ncbi:MAG TPA: dipeptide epimerase [Coleofasciculaceae cyanobacterium]
MRIGIETFTVHQRFPVTPSGGTTAQTTNIWVRVEEQGIEGWGEASPLSVLPASALPAPRTTSTAQTTEVLLEALEVVAPMLEAFCPWERQKIERVLAEAEVPSAVWAAIDMALHDWLGKYVGMPLWRLWGLNRRRIVPTFATVAITTSEEAKQRVNDWMPLTGGGMLQVKLGSPEGIAADCEMLLAIRDEAPEAQLSVDANGSWNLGDAIKMCEWLETQGVRYVEQPLAAGQEADLRKIYERSPIPIFIDESCFTSYDIPKLADRVHGINIKLMRSGGLTEAIRMVHTARACGLQVMFGCDRDSALANTAASHLSPLADFLLLDSHLNLVDDPFTGATVQNGRLIPNDLPGLGVECQIPSINS